MSFSAFSLSVMTRVYRYLLQRTLNFTLSLFFLIFTAAGQKKKRKRTRLHREKSPTLVQKCPLPGANNGWCFQERMRLLHLASFLLAVSRKSLISSILRGCEETSVNNVQRSSGGGGEAAVGGGGAAVGQQGDVRGPVELKSPRGSRNSALGPSLLSQDCDASRARQPEMFGRLANG